MPLPTPLPAAAVTPRPELLACEECDALYRRVALPPSQQARCPRCGHLVARGHRLDLHGLLALTLTALAVFAIANLQPLVTLNLRGVRNTTSLPAALWDTWASGQWGIALLAGAVVFVFPLAAIVLRLYALTPLWLKRLPPGWRAAMRGLRFASRWSMLEVLLLSALVAIVRIAAMASVVPGPGLYAFGALALLLASLESAGVRRLWQLADGSGT